MPILLWPFPTGIAPPPFPILRRAPTGKVFLIHSDTNDFFGPPPVINESCVLIFYPISTGPNLGASPLQFSFTDPYGNTQFGDPSFAFVSSVPITEHFPTVTIPAGSAVYTFGVGELTVPGQWTVQVTAAGYQSRAATFPVTLFPVNLL